MPTTAGRRLPLLALGVLSLLAGLWGGLLRLGLDLPTLRDATAADHGPLMALGFLGTVIALERAVALRRRWGYVAPAAAGLGGIVLLAGGPGAVGWALFCLGSVVLVLVYATVLRTQPTLHLAVEAAGAVCWYVATVLWWGGFTIPRLTPWLAGFLVLTVVGERLELARVALLTRASVRWFGTGAVTFGVGLVLSTTAPGPVSHAGIRVAGSGLVLLAAWGARHDVARRTVKVPGLTRYMAVCLLAGYAWLLVGGVVWATAGDLGASTGVYDAGLHAVFLGFVMSMIFAHAPVIVPSVLRVRLPYRPSFYAHVALLHAGLVVRVVGGDALGDAVARQVGGVVTEVAILLFIAASAAAVLGARSPAAARARKADT